MVFKVPGYFRPAQVKMNLETYLVFLGPGTHELRLIVLGGSCRI